jgi:hypothetical protein
MAAQALIDCTERENGARLFPAQCQEEVPAGGEAPLRVQDSDGESASGDQWDTILAPKGEIHIDARPRISHGADPIGVQVEMPIILASFHENG